MAEDKEERKEEEQTKQEGPPEEEKKKGEERHTEESGETILTEPVKIRDLLLMTMYSLEGKAWAYLGLVAHPETKKPKKDLQEAKLAIDVIDTVFNSVKDKLNDQEKKDLQTRLSNLKLNFVKDQSETK